jgi:hypothetical protein
VIETREALMSNKKTITYSVVPTDQSPEGVEELEFILKALLLAPISDREVNNEEELRAAVNEYLARPQEERDRQAREILVDAKRRFREMKMQEKGCRPVRDQFPKK